MTTSLVPVDNNALIRSENAPPAYRLFAFSHPLNILFFLMGLVTTAFIVGSWPLALGVATMEGAWLAAAPFLPFVRRRFDRKQDQKNQAVRRKNQMMLIGQVAHVDQQRFFRLRDRLQQAQKKTQSMQQAFQWFGEREKILFFDVLDDFLRLGVLSRKYHDDLTSVSVESLQLEIQRCDSEIQNVSSDDSVRLDILIKNREVVLKRQRRQAEALRQRSVVQAQMDLIENTFMLLLDEATSPGLSVPALARLSELHDAMDTLTQTYQETLPL